MHNNIPPRVFDALPDNLKQVAAQVLEITGIGTKALPFTAQFLEEQPGFARAEGVIDIDPERHAITIWYDPDKVTASAIGHELIHLRRNIVEGVPKLFHFDNASPVLQFAVNEWENELEHLIVVPEQLKAFPEAKAWWAEHYSALVDRDKADESGLMFAWSFIRNVLPDEVGLAQRCKVLLNKYQIAMRADYLRADLKKAGADKAELIHALLQFFPDIKNQVGVGRYVVIDHKLTVKPVDQ